MSASQSQSSYKKDKLVLTYAEAGELVALSDPKQTFTVALPYDPEFSTWKFVPTKVNDTKYGKDLFQSMLTVSSEKDEDKSTPMMYFHLKPNVALKEGDVYRIEFLSTTNIREKPMTRSLYYFLHL